MLAMNVGAQRMKINVEQPQLFSMHVPFPSEKILLSFAFMATMIEFYSFVTAYVNNYLGSRNGEFTFLFFSLVNNV